MNIYLDSIPRGQLNSVILSTMLDNDKYGYEIIEDILNASNGKIEIKQPSLYSALKRLEASQLLTSYWRESEIGGNRHYYSLTDLGKKTAKAWLDGYKKITGYDNKIDGRILTKEETLLKPELEEKEEKVDILESQMNLFDKINVQKEEVAPKKQERPRVVNLTGLHSPIQLKQYSETDRKAEFERIKSSHNNCFSNTSCVNKAPTIEDVQLKKEEQNFNKFDNFLLNEPAKLEPVKEESSEKTEFNFNKYDNARDGYFIVDKENKKEEQDKKDEFFSNIVTSTEIKDVKDDGVFLKEYETLENKPEVKRIEPAQLNIETQSPASDITFKQEVDYSKFNNRKIEELKTSAASATTPRRSRPTFSSYLGLKNYFSHMGIKFNEYKHK